MCENYLSDTIKLFKYYKTLAEKTFEQLDEKQLFWKYNDESNSIAILIGHLAGNMLSRWTDFLQSDGEKSWRNRDSEFEEITKNKKELLLFGEKGWSCLLESLKNSDLQKIIFIRNQGHTVIEAINRQLAHYPYHIGQIVFIGKMTSIEPWKSLSIPKRNSKTYNNDKFNQEKSINHFTNEFIKNSK